MPNSQPHVNVPPPSYEGAITVKGSRKFNQYYASLTRRIQFCGVKLGTLSSTPPTDVTYSTLKNYTQLLCNGTAAGDVSPSNSDRYIPIVGIYPQDYDNGTILKLSVLLNSPLAEMGNTSRELRNFHEIGVYAQVCQNDFPLWKLEDNIAYRERDIVRTSDGRIWQSLISNNYDLPEDSSHTWEECLYDPMVLDTKTNQRWYPVPGSEGDPFLFYVVAKYDYPLCISSGITLRYDLNIELSSAEQSNVFYIPQDDTIAFPEIQMAFLENMSWALRDARDQMRIGQVAIKGLQNFVEKEHYRTGDFVRGDVVVKDNKFYIFLGSNTHNNIFTAAMNSFLPAGKMPADNQGWMELTTDMINLRNTWESGKSYVTGDVVVWNNKIWGKWNFSGAVLTNQHPDAPTRGGDPIWREITF